MGRYIDFDAARAERKREPVVVRAFGEDWQLPASLPAAPVLDIIAKDSGDDLTPSEGIALLRQIIPSETFAAWLERGLDLDDLMDLISLVMRAYNPGGGEGEATTPSDQGSSVSAGG